jgi:hypothetical protein
MNPSDAFFELKRQFAVATMNYARAVDKVVHLRSNQDGEAKR